MKFYINVPISSVKIFLRTLFFFFFIMIPLQADQCVNSAANTYGTGSFISFGSNTDLTTPSYLLPTQSVTLPPSPSNNTCITDTGIRDCNASGTNFPFTSFMKTQAITIPTINQTFSSSTFGHNEDFTSDANITSTFNYDSFKVRISHTVSLNTTQEPLKITTLLVDDVNSFFYLTNKNPFDLEAENVTLGSHTFLTLDNVTHLKTASITQGDGSSVTLPNIQTVDAGRWNIAQGSCSKLSGHNADYKFKDGIDGTLTRDQSSIIIDGADSLYTKTLGGNNIYINANNISIDDTLILDNDGNISINTTDSSEVNMTVGGSTTFNTGSQVCLAAGDYYFNNLELGSNVHVDPIGTGTVRIFVKGTFKNDGAGSYINQDGDPSQMLIYTKNDTTLNANGGISGLIISDGNIGFGSNHTQINGALIANTSISLEADTHITYDNNVNYIDSNDSHFTCETNSTKSFSYTTSNRCAFAYTPQTCASPSTFSSAGTAPAGYFNVAMSNKTTHIEADNTDPLSTEHSKLNAIPTQISSKDINISIVSLDADFTTPKKFKGLVALELIQQPDYRSTDTEAQKITKCENSTPYYPTGTQPLLTYPFSNSIFSPGTFSLPNAYKNTSFRVHYVKDSSGIGAVNWNCTNNTNGCIWGMLESTYHTNIPCENVCKPGHGTGANQKSDACIACVFGPLSTIAGVSCARDNFAIRPEKFKFSNLPVLPRAGKDYNITVTAVDYNDTNISTYSTVKNKLSIGQTVYYPDGATSPTLNGTLAFSTSDFNITNGTANDVGVTFDDVGKINVNIMDTTWAQVDIDSGDNHAECNNTEDANGTVGAYICGDFNTTFIPHHFALTNVHLKNFNNGTYTYIANDLNISAGINVTVTAENDKNNTTYNFATASWENPVDINFTINDTTLTENKNAITETLKLGFTNGVTDINSTDINTSRNLIFNFNRETNSAINPFLVQGSDINLTASSLYSATAPSTAQVTITGTSLADQNATFIYGRTHAPRYRFADDNGTAFIYYEAYCSGSGCNKALLPNGSDSNSTDDPRWFISTDHNTSSGTVGSVNQKSANHVTSGNVVETPAKATAALTYDTTRDYPYKATMENNASSWLIYNKYNAGATKNEFEVEFEKSGAWAGKYETNTTTKTDDSNITSRRLMW